MRFTFSALVALIVATPVVAQEDGLTGYWKFNVHDGGIQSYWLMHIEKDKDNKLVVSAEPLNGAPKVKTTDVAIDGDTMRMKLIATINTSQGPKQLTFEFEARLPNPGAKKIFGSFSEGGSTVAVVLETTAAKTPFEVDREMVLKTPNDPRTPAAVIDLIEKAKENKVDAKDLQAWVDTSMKTAEILGPHFQRKHGIRMLSGLQGQKAYESIAVETARRLIKLADPKLPLDAQSEVLGAAAKALRTTGEAKEAETLAVRLDGLEVKAYEEYNAKPPFKTEKFTGRKAKSNRAVLVELFTGAQCPPCVAADLAFDGLERTYGPGEVVLLQYHMDIPAPEPMINKDADDRFKHYADAFPKQVRGMPTALFNGKIEAPGGGSRDDAVDKYKEYCEAVNKRLELADAVKLAASAARTGEKIDITAKVEGVDKPGAKVRLRLVLVEDWVRFKGGNGIQYHHRVVRAMPGGVRGIAIEGKDLEHKANVDLDELRANLNRYLDDEFPDGP